MTWAVFEFDTEAEILGDIIEIFPTKTEAKLFMNLYDAPAAMAPISEVATGPLNSPLSTSQRWFGRRVP